MIYRPLCLFQLGESPAVCWLYSKSTHDWAALCRKDARH